MHPRSSTSSKEKKHEENYTTTCQNQIAQNQGKNTQSIQNKAGNEQKKNKEQMRQRENKSKMADRNPIIITILNIMV